MTRSGNSSTSTRSTRSEPRAGRPLLEVCVASVDDALAAAAAGADRLELCVGLELGGLTPSLGLIAQVRDAVALPIIALIRPRAGDFCFSSHEQQVMLRDVDLLLACDVDGIACGLLTADGNIDREFWRKVVGVAGDAHVVFHRAFDHVADQAAALETLVELGTTRVLSSGSAETAWAGAKKLARLMEQAADRIEILPAGGIDAEHVAKLLQATGCQQVHGSFRQLADGPLQTSAQRVAAARAALDAWRPY